MQAAHMEIKRRLEEQRETLKAELAEGVTRAENGMGYGTHQADDAYFASEQAADIAVMRNAQRLLYAVEFALSRIEEGTYGACLDCGKPIDPARLRIIPYCNYCVECATHHQDCAT
nr:TraR/DksA C4-type zinc finger protein [Anaerolineae bacterium]